METLTPELLSCLCLVESKIRLQHFSELEDLSFAPANVAKARVILERCYSLGAQVVHPLHKHYPEAFRRLERPPLFLSCWGRTAAFLDEGLSVVGSREPTRQSLEWMELHLSDFLKTRKCMSISGGARGIDQKAHALSIRENLPTTVFLPSGLDQPYPDEIGKWRTPILDAGGLIVTEYPPGQTIFRGHFQARNRLIASLGSLVLVVEARRRSGSLMTARLARENGRTVAIVPSFPGDPRSAGTLDLLFDGSFPVRDSTDLEVLYSLSVSSMPGAG